MADESVKEERDMAIETVESLETAEQFREAIGVLAKAITELETVAKAQGEMLQAQDLAIKGLVRLQTSDHVSIEYLDHQRKRNADQR
jgi:hypothetical protein